VAVADRVLDVHHVVNRDHSGDQGSEKRNQNRQCAPSPVAGGVSVFEVAKIAGTSIGIIEKHYGALLDGATASIAGRLDAIEQALTEPAHPSETTSQ
jgi:hypothetical protein